MPYDAMFKVGIILCWKVEWLKLETKYDVILLDWLAIWKEWGNPEIMNGESWHSVDHCYLDSYVLVLQLVQFSTGIYQLPYLLSSLSACFPFKSH